MARSEVEHELLLIGTTYQDTKNPREVDQLGEDRKIPTTAQVQILIAAVHIKAESRLDSKGETKEWSRGSSLPCGGFFRAMKLFCSNHHGRSMSTVRGSRLDR